MKAQTKRGAFTPLMLIIETPYEYDCISLGLRIGADGIRAAANGMHANQAKPIDAPRDAAACLDFARSLLENPEVTK